MYSSNSLVHIIMVICDLYAQVHMLCINFVINGYILNGTSIIDVYLHRAGILYIK